MISKEVFENAVSKIEGYSAIVLSLDNGVHYRYSFMMGVLGLRNGGMVYGSGFGKSDSGYLKIPGHVYLFLNEYEFTCRFLQTKTQRLFKALKDINENKTSILS